MTKRAIAFGLMALLSGLLVVACQGGQRLTAVNPLPPPVLPAWIERVSPTGQAQSGDRLQILFREPLVAVTDLDSPQTQRILAKFAIAPAVPGRFRLLTPRLVTFQGDRAFPKAARLQVTLKAGLADTAQNRLAQDLRWTFETEGVTLTELPKETDGPVSLNPELVFVSNTRLDLGSLQSRVQVRPEGGEPLRVRAIEKDLPSRDRQQRFAELPWRYALLPGRLAPGTRYRVEFGEGLQPYQGNVPLAKPVTAEFRTYGALTFEKLTNTNVPDLYGAYGRFVDGSGELKFSNPLQQDSVAANLRISPAPAPGVPWFRSYEETDIIALNPYALQPNTRYEIELGANLTDVFGQKLGQKQTVVYETKDLAADLWAPDGLNVFPVGQGDLKLHVATTNLPDRRFRLQHKALSPEDLVFLDAQFPEDGLRLPEEGDLLSVTSAALNQVGQTEIPVQRYLGQPTGVLAYRVSARTYRYREENQEKWREPVYTGLIHLTNIGVFSQWFPTGGWVMAHTLQEGQPIPNAEVLVYPLQIGREGGTAQICAQGRTDGAGRAEFGRADLRACVQEDGPPELLVVVRSGGDWSFVQMRSWNGAYGYGVNSGWEGESSLSRGIVFSDRRLYRPGETVWLSGFAYFLENGEVGARSNTAYTVTLRDPGGQSRELGRHTTDRFGSFALSVSLPADAALGEYQVVAKDERGGEIRGGFRIAEFQPPNFQATLTLGDGKTIVAGQTLTAQAKATYLFGAPVRSGKVTYTVVQERGKFQPSGWEEFTFGPEWFWPREAPEIPYQVLTATQALDRQGQAQQTLNLPKEIPYPLTYVVAAEITDISNRSVAANQVLTVLPGDRLIGLKAGFIGEAGQPLPVEFVVTDGAGKPDWRRVKLELQRMTFRQVAQAIEGGIATEPQVEYETVAETELFSGEGPRSLTLTPPSAGSYRIRANFVGATTEATATDWQVWVSGGQAYDWGGRYRNNRLELKLDKTAYRPGERARVVVPSPYPEAELWVAVVRDRLLYQKAVRVSGAAPQVEIPITEAMGPNAAIQAVLVRRGAPLATTDLSAVPSLTRVGLAPFTVDMTARYLNLTTTPKMSKLAPGKRQTLTFQLRDKIGQPVAGKLAIAVVDEAILQLTNYRFPDLVKTVFAEREISQRFGDNRQDVVLQPLASALEKGWGFGGGGEGGDDPALRTQLEPLAYFNGNVVTNAQGQGEVSFSLPDNLTTWRVLAVATDGKLRFGQDDRATFVATKPLLANPLTPAFVRPGDRPQIGVAVTGAAQNLQLTAEISAGKTSLARRTEPWSFSGGTQSQRWELVVPNPLSSDLAVSYQVQGAAVRDGVRTTVPVRSGPAWEQTVTTGVQRAAVEIPLEISADRTAVQELTVILGTSALADAEWAGAGVLSTDQDNPFLETQISRLRVLGTWQRLGRRVPQAQINDVLQKLRDLQRPDGGLAGYPQAQGSDPLLTPLAWEALQPWSGGPNRNTLRNYLESLLANPGRVGSWTPLAQQQIRLGVLLALGPRSDFAADLWAQRERLDLLGQVQLARHLSRLPEWQAEAQTLSQTLLQRWSPGSRSDLPTVPPRWQWLGNRTALQAEYLRLALTRNESEESLARLVQGLLDLRQDGTWGSTYANGAAWWALGAYREAQPSHNLTVTVQVAGQRLTANLQGDRPFQQKITELPPGRQMLRLQPQGNRPLHYTVVYRYTPKIAPGRLEGLRIARTITLAGEAKPQQQHFLSPVPPLTLKTGDVVDVGLEIAGDRPLTHLQIEDFLPAGLEAVDRSFAIANPAVVAQPSAWEIQQQEIQGDRVRGYAEKLEPGAYEFHYLARAVTPGTYQWPGATVTARHAPETFGRTVAAQLQLKEP